MSTSDKPSGQQGQGQNFPPPPPGPPPAKSSEPAPRRHSNEIPLPDYEIPPYNPANPQFAAPPGGDDDIYNASPVDDKPPKSPKWGFYSSHHRKDSDGKKKNRLSAFGEAFTSKVAGPVNALAHKFGSEGFLPESLDKECEKAARILSAFCKDGIYTDAIPGTATTVAAPSGDGKTKTSSGTKKPRTLLTIPSKVIAKAQGLAIFTAVRVAFQASGSSGSGILIARLPDGSWSPPSAIQVTSIGAGFVAGVDIYDCVVVINTREALELFTRTRLSLGSDLAVTAGPFGVGGALDFGVPPPPDKEKDKTRTEPAPAAAAAATETTPGPAPVPVPAPAPASAPAAAGTTTSPLSADNTHFATPIVPEEVLNTSDDESAAAKKGKGKAKAKPAIPAAFRDALKKPVYSYVKSRGLFAGIHIDGTVIVPRENANARFYGQPVSVKSILAGEVPAVAGATTTTTTTTATTATTASAAPTTPETSKKSGLTWPEGAKPLYQILGSVEAAYARKQAEQAAAQESSTTTTTTTNPTQPQGIWIPPPPPPSVASITTTTTTTTPPPPADPAATNLTRGVQNLSVADEPGSSSTAPTTNQQLPAEYYSTPAALAKAAEAAAEAEAARRAEMEELAELGEMPPPPGYFDPSHPPPPPPGPPPAAGGSGGPVDDLPPPPAYDDASAPPGFVPDRKG